MEGAIPLREAITRIRSRLTAVGIATAAAAALWAFYTSEELQAKTCALPGPQPFLSDACGSLSLGARPNRAERLAWRDVIKRPGDCAALRAHIAKYPDGAYRQEARDLLEARHVSANGPWVTGQSMIDIYQPRQRRSLASVAAARQSAITDADSLAERECRKQAGVLQARFVRAAATPEDWACDAIGGGVVCGFQGHATCEIETPVEICGAAR